MIQRKKKSVKRSRKVTVRGKSIRIRTVRRNPSDMEMRDRAQITREELALDMLRRPKLKYKRPPPPPGRAKKKKPSLVVLQRNYRGSPPVAAGTGGYQPRKPARYQIEALVFGKGKKTVYYYWTGVSFNTDRSKAATYATLALVETVLKGMQSTLPSQIEHIRPVKVI